MTTPKWLEHAERRGSERPWALGSVLDEYCRNEGLTREQLASFLGCKRESLAWLSLCRRPAGEQFAGDVTKIAGRFEVNPAKLAQIVRRVDALAALRRPRDLKEDDAMLLAARDRDEEKDE
jgi:hypothetical protein